MATDSRFKNTVFIRLQSTVYIASFFIISCGLQSRMDNNRMNTWADATQAASVECVCLQRCKSSGGGAFGAGLDWSSWWNCQSLIQIYNSLTAVNAAAELLGLFQFADSEFEICLLSIVQSFQDISKFVRNELGKCQTLKWFLTLLLLSVVLQVRKWRS